MVPLRLDLFPKIDPSDLWLRLCWIMRLDRSSQGSLMSEDVWRRLTAAFPVAFA